jgi:hypothetical protein
MLEAGDPKVIIVSSNNDIHAHAVSQTLIKKFACPTITLDLTRYPTLGKLSTRMESGTLTSTLSDPFRFSINSEQTVWWRRPEPFSTDEQVWDSNLRAFIRQECLSTLLGMLYASRCRVVNSIEAEERASHKILQLQIAKTCGFQIPQTLVTNDPVEVLAFNDRVGGQVIYKPQTDVKYHFAETRLLDENALQKLDSVSLAPVIFQEFIPAAFDIRLTVAGRKIFATKIHSQEGKPKLDWRVDLLVPMESIPVPNSIVAPTHQLMAQLGLDYGALDLRVTPQGEIYFFEVNPSGQFLFCELNGRLEITEALCEVLIGNPVC